MAIVLLISVATGIAFYRIRWADLLLRPRSRGLRAWLSTLHRAGGVWMFAFSLVFGLTGLWYFVERAVQDVGLPLPGVEAMAMGQAAAADDAGGASPGLNVQGMYFPARPGAAITLYGEGEAWLVRPTANYVLFDPFAGAVVSRQSALELSPGARLIQSVDPLHFGDFGGLPTKLLWLVAGLAISGSILSGAYLWHLRLEQGSPAQESPSPVVMRGALAVTLAVLALATYGSIVNIGESIAHEGDLDLTPVYVWVVVAGFVATTALIAIVWLAALAFPPNTRRGVRTPITPPGRREFRGVTQAR